MPLRQSQPQGNTGQVFQGGQVSQKQLIPCTQRKNELCTCRAELGQPQGAAPFPRVTKPLAPAPARAESPRWHQSGPPGFSSRERRGPFHLAHLGILLAPAPAKAPARTRSLEGWPRSHVPEQDTGSDTTLVLPAAAETRGEKPEQRVSILTPIGRALGHITWSGGSSSRHLPHGETEAEPKVCQQSHLFFPTSSPCLGGQEREGRILRSPQRWQERRQQVTDLTNLLISLFERHSLYVLDTAFSVPLIIGQVIKHKKQNKIFLKDYIQTPDYYLILFFFVPFFFF